MKGLSNKIKARAELASWPQFAGSFQEEEAKVEEGKQKQKEWPKTGKEEERANKARQRAKLKKKQPTERPAKKEAEAAKKKRAQTASRWEKLSPSQQEAEKAKRKVARQKAKSKKMENERQLKWKALTTYSMVISLEGLHSMAKRQRSMASQKEVVQGGRKCEVAWSRIKEGCWNIELLAQEEVVEDQWYGEEYFWGGKALEELQNGQKEKKRKTQRKKQLPHEWVSTGPGKALVFENISFVV